MGDDGQAASDDEDISREPTELKSFLLKWTNCNIDKLNYKQIFNRFDRSQTSTDGRQDLLF